jgi:hypothetical protein
MNDNPPRNAAILDEELVAYLDGELDAEGARRIEALLATDPEIRRRLQSFERTWELLDELDAAPASEPFTQTTLEMVAIAARQDVERDKADAPRRRRRNLLLFCTTLLVAAAIGFLAVALYDPDRQLVRDLPLLEDLDEYRQVGSIDFLRKLDKARLFSRDAAEPLKNETPDKEDFNARRRRIAEMSPDEKEQLTRSEEHFTGLSVEEQGQVGRLHEDLQSDPDAERLRGVMHDYCEWLKRLSPITWASLVEMKPDERIAEVKRLMQDQQRREIARRPGHKDMEVVRKWIHDCAANHEKALLATLPEDQRKRFAEWSKPLQRQVLFGQILLQWQQATKGKLPATVSEEDLARLREKLSPAVRKRLEGKPAVEQWRLVFGWMMQGLRHFDEGWRMPGALPKDDDEYLAEFFENELTPEKWDQLLRMPVEDMQLWLQQELLGRRRPPERRWWNDGREKSGRPGEGRPPPPWKHGPAPPPPPRE